MDGMMVGVGGGDNWLMEPSWSTAVSWLQNTGDVVVPAVSPAVSVVL